MANVMVAVRYDTYCGCSEKLDVEDHYVAWRQTHDQPQHQFGLDGPFSFCSYPFLLNPRAKSKLLHTEARFLMTQVCPLTWPVQDLYVARLTQAFCTRHWSIVLYNVVTQ